MGPYLWCYLFLCMLDTTGLEILVWVINPQNKNPNSLVLRSVRAWRINCTIPFQIKHESRQARFRCPVCVCLCGGDRLADFAVS